MSRGAYAIDGFASPSVILGCGAWEGKHADLLVVVIVGIVRPWEHFAKTCCVCLVGASFERQRHMSMSGPSLKDYVFEDKVFARC